VEIPAMIATIEQTQNSTKILQELVLRLSRLGYSEFYASFNPASPLSYWQRNLDDIPPVRSVDSKILAEGLLDSYEIYSQCPEVGVSHNFKFI
jgi:hypothetical protein